MRVFVYEALCAGALGDAFPPSLSREGWAMLSIAEDFARVPDVEVWTLLEEGPGPDVGHVCRRTRGYPDEPRHFRELAARADWTMVIAPEFAGLLEERSRWVLEAGGRLLGSTPEAVRLTADKLTLAGVWQAHRVPTPPTSLLTDEGPAEFPAVCKPRDGAGSQAIFLIAGPADWPEIRTAVWGEWRRDLIVQPYVRGLAASVALLLGPDRWVALPPAAQHLSADGRFHYRGGAVPLPSPLAARALALARAAVAPVAGLQGYVGVDLVLGADEDGRGDAAIEINPRLTTSYVGLRRLCRENLAEAWLRLVQGEGTPPLTWNSGSVEFDADGSWRAVEG